MLTVLLIALSLALDAFAVSVSCGVSVPGFAWPEAFKLGVWFGSFQFAMSMIGWFLGSRISLYIHAVDFLVAFGLLTFIGLRMIWDAVRGETAPEGCETLGPGRLALLAVATSIDALAVGVPMSFMELRPLPSCTVIGLVAFSLSLLGGLIGKKLGTLFRRGAGVAGGLVLVALGVKFLVERLCSS